MDGVAHQILGIIAQNLAGGRIHIGRVALVCPFAPERAVPADRVIPQGRPSCDLKRLRVGRMMTVGKIGKMQRLSRKTVGYFNGLAFHNCFPGLTLERIYKQSKRAFVREHCNLRKNTAIGR